MESTASLLVDTPPPACQHVSSTYLQWQESVLNWLTVGLEFADNGWGVPWAASLTQKGALFRVGAVHRSGDAGMM